MVDLFVSAVTKRLVGGVAAATQKYRFFGFNVLSVEIHELNSACDLVWPVLVCGNSYVGQRVLLGFWDLVLAAIYPYWVLQEQFQVGKLRNDLRLWGGAEGFEPLTFALRTPLETL